MWKKILAVSVFGLSLFIALLFFLQEAWMLYCFVFLYGFSHGCRIPAHLDVLGEFYGMKILGLIIGMTVTFGQTLGGFAPYLAGYIFDLTGSYRIAFMIVMMLLFMSGITALVIKNPLESSRPLHRNN